MNSKYLLLYTSRITPLLLFVLTALLHRQDVLPTLHTHYIGGDRLDGGLYVFIVKEILDSVFSLPSSWFDINMLYPFGNALAYTDNFLLPALIAKIALYFTDSIILSYNIAIITGWSLNGYCMYILARHYKMSTPLSLLAGLTFQWYPFFVAHTSHPQLQFAFFVPLALFALSNFLVSPQFRYSFLLGASIVGAFLSSAYYSLFIVLLAAVILPSGWIAFRCKPTISLCKSLALPALIWAVVLLPFALPYLEVRGTFGTRPSLELKMLSSSLLAYATSPLGNTLLGPSTHQWSHFEASSFPGILISSLLALALLFATYNSLKQRTHKAEILLYSVAGLCVIVSATFDLHAYLYGKSPLAVWTRAVLLLIPTALSFAALFWRRDHNTQQFKLLLFLTCFFVVASLGITSMVHKNYALFGFLFDYFPGFNSIRASGRLSVVVQTILIVIAFSSAQKLLQTTPRYAQWGLALCGALFCFWETRFYFAYQVNASEPRPALYQELNAHRDGAIIALPIKQKSMNEVVYNQTEYMNWFSEFSIQLVNGYSGHVPGFHRRLLEKIKHFPDANSLRHLSSIAELRYIMFHGGKVENFSEIDFEQAIAQHPDQLQIVATDRRTYLLSFKPKFTQAESAWILPSTKYSRGISFDLTTKLREGQSSSLTIVKTDKKQLHSTTLFEQPISSNAETKKINLILPSAKQNVYPQILLFKIPNLETANVRNTKITEE